MGREREFREEKVMDTARAALRGRKICDNCLGRQLANVSTGMTNRERGAILRKILKAKEPRQCDVCSGIFRELDSYADQAASRMCKLDYSTFLVGSILSSDLISREESMWEDIGIEYCESIKSELNRELGKLIYDRVGKEHDAKSPDVTVILNLRKGRIDLGLSPLFIYGEYRKLVRGLPQTKWDRYDETVEDIVAAPFMIATGGTAHSLHGSGREDIDALCLDGRPFVLEIKEPKKRRPDLRDMQRQINRSGKVEVHRLSFTAREEVARIKAAKSDKKYRALVEFEKPVRDPGVLSSLEGAVIKQRTPSRVEHRRADKIRERKVHSISWKEINNKKFELQIKGEAGLYIKELISGDNGRSAPSVAGLLKNRAAVKELDVIKIWK